MIVAPSADLDMAVRAIVFSAVGTAGQRCTSLRRLIVHNSIREDLVKKLAAAYATLPIGDPRETATLIGPLVDLDARDRMQSQLKNSYNQIEKLSGHKERIIMMVLPITPQIEEAADGFSLKKHTIDACRAVVKNEGLSHG